MKNYCSILLAVMVLFITSCSSQASVESVEFTTITNTLQKASNPGAELPYDSVSVTYSIAWPTKGNEVTIKKLQEWTLKQIGIEKAVPENAKVEEVKEMLDKHAQMLLAQDATDADGSSIWQRNMTIAGEPDTPFEGYASMTSEIVTGSYMVSPEITFGNISIRISDGEVFDVSTAIADENLLGNLFVKGMEEKYIAENADWDWREEISTFKENLSMIQYTISLTREGVEVNGVLNEITQGNCVIPYDKILPALSAKAKAFLPKDITGEDAKEEQSEPEAAEVAPKEDAVNFLYQTFYINDVFSGEDSRVGRCSLGYTKDALNKFKELGIDSEPNYPTNASLAEGNDYYKPFYTDNLNSLLKKVTAALETTDNIEYMMMMRGDFEGAEEFTLNIKKVDEVSPEKVIVTATENPNSYDFTYVLVKQNGKWYIDDIYSYRENAKDILGN